MSLLDALIPRHIAVSGARVVCLMGKDPTEPVKPVNAIPTETVRRIRISLARGLNLPKKQRAQRVKDWAEKLGVSVVCINQIARRHRHK